MKWIALTACLLLNGCGLGVLVAGVGAAKAGGAKQREVAVLDKQAYSNYRIEMEKLNFEREKDGLQPKDIMNFDQWAGLSKKKPGNMSDCINEACSDKEKQ